MSFRSLASLRVAAFFAVSLLLTACEGDRPELLSGVETIEVPAANPGAQTNQNIADPTLVIPDTFPVSEGDELTLVFEEEFERSDINPEVWFFATGDGTEKGLPGGWGNNELQYYLPDNAQIVNGVLEITARRENVGGLNYSSARINTEDRFAFKYGRIEASMKLPSGQGLWPAFWMLSQDSDYECDADGRACVWAATGEIDIVEAINLDGTNGNEIFATLHYGGEFPANQESSVTYTPSVDVTESFNTYAIEWDANEIRWYFNGLLYAVQNSWNSAALNAGPSAPFDQNFHVLLNLAVGGNFPGDPNGTTPFPATMEVDWVRVYSGEDPAGGAATEPNVSAPTPTEDPTGVISLFSDAYDDIAGIDYNPFWGQGTVVTIAQIAGNEMLRYGNLDYQGTDFAGNPQDVSDKGYLHLDFWTADSTALSVYLISPGPVETSYELTGDIAPNSWVSVDIPLSEFAGVDLTNLIQLKFDGNGTVFLDNLYFAGEAPETGPTAAATAPTQAAGDAISLFSNAYTNVTVDTWSAGWDSADVADVQVAGDDVKLYTNLVFAGIEFTSAPIDATGMTHFRMDIWTPDAPGIFKIKLVDAGADGVVGTGGDDTEHELTFDAASTPAIVTGEWISFDIPLTDFVDMTGNGAIAQLIISGELNTVYVDNVYFYNAGGGTGGDAPTAAATAPTQAAGDAISLFSNAYTNVTVDTWSAGWDSADVADVQVAGDDVKLYTNLVFAGIEFTSAPIDATGMTHFRMDIWTPDAPGIFKIKLVDAGADGVVGTGGDDTEHELTFDAASTPAIVTGEWISFDIPLTDFVDMTGNGAIAQLIISGELNTVYVDNVYFYNAGGGTGGDAPTAAATAPTQAAGDAISLFSNAYTNVTVDTWSAGWDSADVADVQVAGDDVKLYTNLVFAGIEFTSAPIDATGMTHFRMDIWTPDAPGIFKIKLVDAGADGVVGTGGDDTEHELTFDAASTPAIVTGEWISFDIPLTDFVDMTGNGAIAQLIISGELNTVYVDNVYFYNAGGGTGGDAPTAAATAPTQAAGDAISLFSNAYTNVTVDTWSAGWDSADVADVQVAGDDVKLYTNLVFAGIEFTSAPIDATGMTHFRMDIWTPDAPGIFKIKLVDAGADGVVGTGGDDTEHELTFDAASTPAIVTGEWISFDIPLTDFVDMTGNGAIAQLIISGELNTVYVDNVYFYNAGGGTGGDAPTAAATAPTQAAGDAISLFSNAYTNVTVDTWSAGWDSADVADVQVAGDDVKLYTNLVFAGIEFTSAPIDATGMTHFRMDIWTPDAPGIFKIKLVDAGADGVVGTGGDDTEHELTFDAASTPAIVTGEWISFDIPLTDFVDMTGNGAIAQLIISGELNTVYVDNVYFYNAGGGTGGDGEIAVNGGFENGDLSNWTLFPANAADPNEQTVVTTNPKTGTYAGRINNTTPASASIIKQANLTPVSIGQTATITFSARGSFGVGGVAFAEFFTEVSGGGTSSSQILGGAPLTLDADENVWADFSFVVPIETDVSGGVTLQLTGTTGGDGASFADVYYDDISIVITD